MRVSTINSLYIYHSLTRSRFDSCLSVYYNQIYIIMKKGDKVREIGDSTIGTVIKVKNGYADIKFPKLKGIYSLPVQFLEKV